MTAPSAYTVAREVLAADPALPNDAAVARLKARGVRGADAALRLAVNSVRKKLKQKAAAAPAWVAPAAAGKTTAPVEPTPAPKPAPAAVVPSPTPPAGVTDVLSNVALVNAAVAAAGGVEPARQVAAAVTACGGPDQFAQYLDLVAGIRAGGG